MESPTVVLRNFIGGQLVEPRSNRYLESRAPSTGAVHTLVPDSDELDVDDAVQAAHKAFVEWSATDAAYRSKLLNCVADLLQSQSEEFAEAESLDQGKPLWVAKTVDIPRAVLNFRHFANSVLCDKDVCINESDKGVLHYTSRSPCGVTAVIVPWNLPLYLLTFKLAPALIHGNTVVAKPSEFTSFTAWKLCCSVIKEAGVPDGVVNMVFGRGDRAGEALIRHPLVRLISFTGSDRAGLHIASVAGANAKKVSLEMGGKNACIVFSDADLDECIPTLIRGSFLNQGQICLSTSRIYIQKPIFDIFVNRFVEAVRKIRVGDPFDSKTWMGPVVSREHFDRIQMYLQIARDEGAKFLTGDVEDQQFQLPEENKEGYYIAPVVLTGLSDNSRCVQEEIFGPVTCVLPFEGEEEIVRRANAVRYGLSASIWSRDVGKIHSIAPKLEVGTVWCNCWLIRNLHMPFGGNKMSGLGREGTEDSRDFYTSKKTVCVKYGQGCGQK